MLRTFFFVSFFLTGFAGYGQNDSISTYYNLKTVRFYNVRLDIYSSEKDTFYLVDNNRVSKAEYIRYYEGSREIAGYQCFPCLMQYYGYNDVLLWEQISISPDGLVGRESSYYPNGKLRSVSHFLEECKLDSFINADSALFRYTLTPIYQRHSTSYVMDSWYSIFKNGDSLLLFAKDLRYNIKDGPTIYYDSSGNILYKEQWLNNTFLQQQPEQKKEEIWRVDINFNGTDVDSQTLRIDDISAITVIPHYKNRYRDGTELGIVFTVGASFKPVERVKVYGDKLTGIDVYSMMDKAQISMADEPSFEIQVFKGEKLLRTVFLKVKP